MSCQLQRVTSGQSNSVISRCTFQNSSHIIYLPTYLSIHPSIYLSIYLSVYLSLISLSLFLSTPFLSHLSVYLPAYLPTYLPTYLPIYLNPFSSQIHKTNPYTNIKQKNKKIYTSVKHEFFEVCPWQYSCILFTQWLTPRQEQKWTLIVSIDVKHRNILKK